MSVAGSDYTSESSDFPLTPNSTSSIGKGANFIDKAELPYEEGFLERDFPKPKNQLYIDKNSPINIEYDQRVVLDVICCGVTLDSFKGFLEHVEEHHASSRDESGNLATYATPVEGEELPKVVSYSELLSSTSIPFSSSSSTELSAEDYIEQMVDNFRQAYGEQHLALWNLAEQAKADPVSYYAALEQYQDGQEADPTTSQPDTLMSSADTTEPSTQIGEDNEDSNDCFGGKDFKCPTEGCTKSYKNPNGLKYHLNRGRCSTKAASDHEEKPFKCHHENCFYSYKNTNGLKYHLEHAHKKQEAKQGSQSNSPGSIDPSLLALQFRNIDPTVLTMLSQIMQPAPPTISVSPRATANHDTNLLSLETLFLNPDNKQN